MTNVKYKVKKRDKSVVNFDNKKIEHAIKKAFISTIGSAESATIASLVGQIKLNIKNRYSNIEIIDIENIQDQVELALMREGYYEVAKAYVIYRYERQTKRQKGLKAIHDKYKSRLTNMVVIKRSGVKEPMSINKITDRIMILSKDLKTDALYVTQKVVSGLYNGIHTSQIDEFISEIAASVTPEHYDYSKLAARIKVSNLHKVTPGFIEASEVLFDKGILNDGYYSKILNHKEEIMSIIDYSRDFTFDYFALTTLIKAYLLKHERQPIERPQDMWMRVSLSVTGKGFDFAKVKSTYDLLSKGYYTHATPTLFNSGLKMQQLSSCFLVAMEDDSIEGIFNTLKDCALISKTAGGIGIHMHNIRSSGSLIKKTNGVSNGLIPFIKIFNETARSVDQGGGKRKGSFAVYLEPWHGDIEAFLQMRKSTGAEEFRARDIFFALWIPDLFMSRVQNGEQWTLMSPDTAPGLSDVYGDEFTELYEKYERQNRGVKTLPARELMGRIIDIQIEQGQPFMLYKDAINAKSNQKNIGIIKSSNLCAEIAEYSDSTETSVCNLASIALPKFVKGQEFDYQQLFEVVKIATYNLNNVIDINYYPTKKTSKSNFRHRPIAIGIQGLADVFFKLHIPYQSKRAKKINKNIFETIYYASLVASMELAKKDGKYETFDGSPFSNGILQFDMWNVKPSSGLWDWEKLKQDIKKYGTRNSLLTACMPTASTGIILGNTEAFQIQTSNLYKRQTLSGEFLIINKYLVADLEKLGIWNKGLMDQIVLEDGSIANIDRIPQDLKEIYKTTWEISQKVVIEYATDRAPYIDHTQSMNLWLSKPTFAKVNSMHFYAWKQGLKTGMYYLRSQPSTRAVRVTVNEQEYKKNKEMKQREEVSQRGLYTKQPVDGLAKTSSDNRTISDRTISDRTISNRTISNRTISDNEDPEECLSCGA